MELVKSFEKIINDVKTIEILHNVIKNEVQDFNLTEKQLEFVEKFKIKSSGKKHFITVS